MVWSEQKVLHAKKGERGEETEQEVRWTARHDMRSEGGKVDCAAKSALYRVFESFEDNAARE